VQVSFSTFSQSPTPFKVSPNCALQRSRLIKLAEQIADEVMEIKTKRRSPIRLSQEVHFAETDVLIGLNIARVK
jgi:hypothetical protein